MSSRSISWADGVEHERPSQSPERHFHVDISRTAFPGWSTLGLKVQELEDALLVLSVNQARDTAFGQWNRRCEATFPKDVVQALDHIVSVNSHHRGCEMVAELKKLSVGAIDEVLIAISRDGPPHQSVTTRCISALAGGYGYASLKPG